MRYAIGIDIGGRRIKGVAVTAAGRVLAEVVAPTGNIDARSWTAGVHRVVKRLNQDGTGKPACVGLAAPGLVAGDRSSIACMPGRFRGLEGLNWRGYLKLPSVTVLNDAQAALLGELWLGAARGARNALMLTLGTGVGGAAVVDGRLLHGHIGRAGCFGHISLDPNGAPDITRTPGSLEDAIGDCTVQLRTKGRFTSTQRLIAAVQRRDEAARQVWRASVKALAAGTTSLINSFDPEVVVIGGGISRAGPLLFRPLRRFLRQFEWQPGGARVRVVAARLGDRAGAFGAAWQALQAQGGLR